MTRIFDSHCHYNLEPLADNWQEHWQTAQSHGVIKSTVVGIDLASSQLAITIADQNHNLYPVIGLHPTDHVADAEQLNQDLTTLETLLTEHPEVAAIGETGLDYYWLEDDEQRNQKIEWQKQSFIGQVKLANQHHLPLVIHVRDKTETAYWDVLEILRQHKAPDGKFVLHCVSGPLAYIQEALNMNAYLGVAGNVTYKRADHVRQIVSLAPADRIMVETDAPFLPPQEFRGQTCQPWMVSQTAHYLATDCHVASDQLYQNTLEFFGLPVST